MVMEHVCERCGKIFIGGHKAKLCLDCKDITGQAFGRWHVLGDADGPDGKRVRFLCRCVCGTEKIVLRENLIKGKSTSCGCISRQKLRERHLQNDPDLIGQTFGELKVLRKSGVRNKKTYWLCQCSCGNMTETTTSHLTSGRTRSCGHLLIEHVSHIADCGTNPSSIKSDKLSRRNTSGVKGVWHDKRHDKWIAEIMFARKKYYLGSFSNKDDAAEARAAAEEMLHKKFLKWYEQTHQKE